MLSELDPYKPVLAALLLPPASLLALAALALLLATRYPRVAVLLGATTLSALWVLASPAFVQPLARLLLSPPPPIVAAGLKASGAQAIVVLGGGIDLNAPEWGAAQLNDSSALRVRYAVHLARISGLPLAFSGGVGWSQSVQGAPTEAEVAQSHAATLGARFTWLEGGSRDTRQNADATADLLKPSGIRHVALVSQWWHLPRARAEFERAGFTVTAAPAGTPDPDPRPGLGWWPDARALWDSQRIVREWLGLLVFRWRS